MAAPATAAPRADPIAQARAAAASLSEARLELTDRIIAAEARVTGARDRRATRAVAEQVVDRLVGRMAALGRNFGAALIVNRGNLGEGEVLRRRWG